MCGAVGRGILWGIVPGELEDALLHGVYTAGGNCLTWLWDKIESRKSELLSPNFSELFAETKSQHFKAGFHFWIARTNSSKFSRMAWITRGTASITADNTVAINCEDIWIGFGLGFVSEETFLDYLKQRNGNRKRCQGLRNDGFTLHRNLCLTWITSQLLWYVLTSSFLL